MAAVGEHLILDPTPALVDRLVGKLHQMEGVGDLVDPGQGRFNDLAVGTREVEGGLGHVEAPVADSLLQPGDWLVAVATRNDVEQLTASDIHDRGGETRRRCSPSRTECVCRRPRARAGRSRTAKRAARGIPGPGC